MWLLGRPAKDSNPSNGAEDDSSSDEWLDVLKADGIVMEGVSPVLELEGKEEGAEGLVEEAAEAHPQLEEVPSDDPGAGQEAWWFNEL